MLVLARDSFPQIVCLFWVLPPPPIGSDVMADGVVA